MIVTEQEISELKDFIFQLNSMKDSVIVVEGKRDSIALKKLGYSGQVLEFHKFRGMINFADSVAKYKNIIPCGITDKGVTNLVSIKPGNYKEIKDILIKNFISNLKSLDA